MFLKNERPRANTDYDNNYYANIIGNIFVR